MKNILQGILHIKFLGNKSHCLLLFWIWTSLPHTFLILFLFVVGFFFCCQFQPRCAYETCSYQNCIFENTSKYDLSNSNSHRRVPLYQKNLYQKKFPQRFLFFEFGEFFRIEIKIKSCWIALKILSKEEKQVLERSGREVGVAIER